MILITSGAISLLTMINLKNDIIFFNETKEIKHFNCIDKASNNMGIHESVRPVLLSKFK